MMDHKVGSREDWRAAREELLRREKEHTRMGDELARQRRELPWVRVEKEYRFQTDEGSRTLAELFDGRFQLLVYHFMFGPTYRAGCPTCSSSADAVNGVLPHLHARDVTMLYVSRAPLEKLQAYKRRMGWSFPGCPRPTATSTSTSASPTPTSRCASRWDRSSRASPRPCCARWRPQPGPTWPVTSRKHRA
jgi:predicted dithiol-disulfide oxidoreductase (DUF899 family)